MEKDKIFFAENGLTSTSANHIANMAKEFIKCYESRLADISFVTTTVSLLSGNKVETLKEGDNEESLEYFRHCLDSIAEANSLVAWLREAIKAKERLSAEVEGCTLEKWCKLMEIERPVRPENTPHKTADDIIAEMSVGDRCKYYTLEAVCSTYGTAIHPKGIISNIRKDLIKTARDRAAVEGEGVNAIIYKYSPSIEPDKLNTVFFELQSYYRSKQAELNSILFKIDKEATDSLIEAQKKDSEIFEKYSSELNKLTSRFATWKAEEKKRLASLKILIPNHLKSIYETISKLGA